MTDQKNLIMAIVLSVLVLVAFEWLWPSAPKPAPQGQPQATGDSAPPPAPDQAPDQAAGTQPAAPGGAGTRSDADAGGGFLDLPSVSQAPGVEGMTAAERRSRQTALNQTPRVTIDTPSLTGSINLVGARIDDLTLRDYTVEQDPDSDNITLFSPAGAPRPYFAEQGWVPGDDATVPGPDARWTASGGPLTANNSVTLSWDNGEGLIFRREITLDSDYMFTVTQSVENAGDEAVTLYPYGLVSRTGTPPTMGFFILHEGPLGVVDGSLVEHDYGDVREEGEITADSEGGWIGITDKYWLAALVPQTDAQVKTRFSYHGGGAQRGKYQTDFLAAGLTVPAGGTAEHMSRMFAGAKEVKLLDRYQDELGIDHLDKAVDFGWFYFMTKPIFYLLTFFNGLLGNFGLAIIGLTILIKIVLFPLANKSYKSMSKMKKLQPEMKKLQERFKEDKQRMNQELMALYKKEKVSPVSGCLPILVQIPVFFSLYKVLFVSIEMRQAPFYGWIQDLSQPDPTSIFNLFGLLPFTPPEFLMIGIWPLIMGLTMWLQQKLNPQPTDPTQAKIMTFLPILFTFLLARFPAGLVIYWATNNGLSILQQWVIMRRMGVKAG